MEPAVRGRLPTSGREYSVRDDVETLSEEQLDHLARYSNEEVMSAQKKSLGIRFSALLPDDARNVRWEPGLHPL